MQKPKRLQKLEDAYQERYVDVSFGFKDFDEWTVYLRGYFADFELHEIVKALKSANKAGRL